jgi:lipoprotein-anchoring transpeptidase ErfK/SrfK
MATSAAAQDLTAESVNAAPLDLVAASYGNLPKEVDLIKTGSITGPGNVQPQADPVLAAEPSASIARLQILLDRAGASPGVIDGVDGGNLRSAVEAFQIMRGLPADGKIGPQVIGAIENANQVIGTYVITAEDIAFVVGPISKDYARMAEMPFLGYVRASEGLAERFHMDERFLKTLNPAASFVEGETIFVADLATKPSGKVARIEVDKAKGQLRAYAADGSLSVAYPATIGSETNPSPSGTHTVKTVVVNPNYTYNPKVNFQQGDNDKVLTLPPGPNGPVGTVWIDLSEPTFGIHGTPEPDRIDKTGSHGCVRLTNWDAEELAKLITKGVSVTFM